MTQAMERFAERENLPASLDSEDWESVPREIRERSFFISKLAEAETLQGLRDITDDFVAQKIGINDADKRAVAFLDSMGYVAPAGKEGTIEDLRSARRIAVIMNTNLDMARGHATWLRDQKTLRAFPGQRLIRVSKRVEPRDWPKTWNEARARLADRTMALDSGKDMAAPLNDPIWEEISRFRQPYPPFDWGSGMGLELIGRGEAKTLGVLPPPDDPRMAPQSRSMNESLEAVPKVMEEDLKKALAERLGRFGEWDGEKMIFTDPDGTRPATAAKLKEIWDKPAPEGFERITQKEVLDAWDDGATPDPQDARVTLRRLFDRLVNEEAPPAVLKRQVPLSAAQAVELVKALAARKLTIPGRVAGWTFDTGGGGRVPKAGWLVTFTLRGATLAKDIRALRPGKPGWVIVGGKEFKVTGFKQDPRTRRIDIELEEGGE